MCACFGGPDSCCLLFGSKMMQTSVSYANVATRGALSSATNYVRHSKRRHVSSGMPRRVMRSGLSVKAKATPQVNVATVSTERTATDLVGAQWGPNAGEVMWKVHHIVFHVSRFDCVVLASWCCQLLPPLNTFPISYGGPDDLSDLIFAVELWSWLTNAGKSKTA